MKRILLISVILTAMLLSACAAPTTAPETEAPTTAPPTEATPTPSPAEQPTPAEEPEPTEPVSPPVVEPEPEVTEIAVGGELVVHFIDVGQGDSILIDLDIVEILIDGGGKSPGVVPFLKDYVDGALEVVVATHPHADHIGGLIAVFSAFEVEEVWHTGDSSTSQTFSQFMAGVSSEGADVTVARVGDAIRAGTLVLDILHPRNTEDSANDNSIVLRLTYGEVDFLFEGDAEQKAERDMLDAGLLGDIEVLKVGHHGSKTASSTAFVNLVRPEIAVYMAKEGNSYEHPHQETLDALGEIGASIYGTDIHGNIAITTDGHTFDIVTER